MHKKGDGFAYIDNISPSCTACYSWTLLSCMCISKGCLQISIRLGSTALRSGRRKACLQKCRIIHLLHNCITNPLPSPFLYCSVQKKIKIELHNQCFCDELCRSWRSSLLAEMQFLTQYYTALALFRCTQNFQILENSPSHRIFKRIHEVLNIAK